MPPDGALRKNGKWVLQSLTPNVCLTPGGGTPVPVPYTCFEEGATAENVAASVRFTGQNAFTLESILPTTQNDSPGTAGGVISGTVGGICEPIQCIEVIRASSIPIVCDRQLFWMNNRNCLAVAYYEPVPVDRMKKTDYSSRDECKPAEGQPTQKMTAEEFDQLQTLEEEKAMGRFELQDPGCADPGSAWSPTTPDPDAWACPARHCRNNCIGTRKLNESVAELFSDGTEQVQEFKAIGTQGFSENTYSADQPHDNLCSNPLGQELAKYEEESCERLCAIELGGYLVKHGTEGEPSEHYKKYRKRYERVESFVDKIVDAIEAVEDVIDEAREVLKKVDLIGVPTL
jgi:hypothetical protein